MAKRKKKKMRGRKKRNAALTILRVGESGWGGGVICKLASLELGLGEGAVAGGWGCVKDTRSAETSESAHSRHPFYVFGQNYILSAGISGGGRA